MNRVPTTPMEEASASPAVWASARHWLEIEETAATPYWQWRHEKPLLDEQEQDALGLQLLRHSRRRRGPRSIEWRTADHIETRNAKDRIMKRHLLRLGIFVRARQWCAANEFTPGQIRIGLSGEVGEEPRAWLEIEPGKDRGTVTFRLAAHDAGGRVVRWRPGGSVTHRATVIGLAEAGRAGWQSALDLIANQLTGLPDG